MRRRLLQRLNGPAGLLLVYHSFAAIKGIIVLAVARQQMLRLFTTAPTILYNANRCMEQNDMAPVMNADQYCVTFEKEGLTISQ